MELTIILGPLITALVVFGLGRYLGKNGAFILCLVVNSLGLFFITLVGTPYLYAGQARTIYLGNWITLHHISVDWTFCFDGVAVTMALIVYVVGICVLIFTREYLSSDPYLISFYAYLQSFMAFMVFLVFGENFFILIFAWEGVGLMSFLLIGFWSTRAQASSSAIKAIVANRVADACLIASAVLAFTLAGTFDFPIILNVVPLFRKVPVLFSSNATIVDVLAALIFLGAAGKSAQIGFHTWLPDAMEGPTPVSALLHSATMVALGVYLLVKCAPILEASPITLGIMCVIASITIVVSSLIGAFQFDIKKIIAYSTCTQLGYMVLACGLSQYNVAMYHLANHAFFKALLFLCAGNIIFHVNGEQDIRRLGGLKKSMPLTFSTTIVGLASLNGIFPYSGYYSKHAIIDIAHTGPGRIYLFVYVALLTSLIFTFIYSIKLLHYVFIRPGQSKGLVAKVSESSSMCLLIPLVVLSIFSIFSGYMFKEIYLSATSQLCYAPNFLQVKFLGKPKVVTGFLQISLEELVHYICLTAGLAYFTFLNHLTTSQSPILVKNKPYRLFFGLNSSLEFIIKSITVTPLIKISYVTTVVLDKGILEEISLLGFVRSLNFYSTVLSKANLASPISQALFTLALINLGFLVAV